MEVIIHHPKKNYKGVSRYGLTKEYALNRLGDPVKGSFGQILGMALRSVYRTQKAQYVSSNASTSKDMTGISSMAEGMFLNQPVLGSLLREASGGEFRKGESMEGYIRPIRG